MEASTENTLFSLHAETHHRSLSSGSITYLSVSCDIFLLPLRFFLVKLDFQVGAGNRVSEAARSWATGKSTFFLAARLFLPAPLRDRLPPPAPPPARYSRLLCLCSQSLGFFFSFFPPCIQFARGLGTGITVNIYIPAAMRCNICFCSL